MHDNAVNRVNQAGFDRIGSGKENHSSKKKQTESVAILRFPLGLIHLLGSSRLASPVRKARSPGSGTPRAFRLQPGLSLSRPPYDGSSPSGHGPILERGPVVPNHLEHRTICGLGVRNAGRAATDLAT